MRWFLSQLDILLSRFLIKNLDNMPMRFVKLIANYYTDAKIRKIYWAKLGISMGENTYSNLGLKVVGMDDNRTSVFIGNNVSIAPNVTFITNSTANNGVEINKLDYVKNKLTVKSEITVEDEAWIGANATILPGVSIGKCSVIGAGAVVTVNVEPYCIYAGVPAKKIRSLKN